MDHGTSERPPDLADLVLARLLDPGKAGLAADRILRDLEPIAAERFPGGGWAEAVRSALEDLRARGLAAVERRGKAERARLTLEGRAAALAALGIRDLLDGVTWKTIRDVHLIARALGLRDRSPEALRRIGGAPGLRAAILRKFHRLPAAECPKGDESIRALLWRGLGVESVAPFTMKAVQEVLLGRLLGSPGRQTAAQMKALLPAKAVGAPRGDISELRAALLRSILSPDRADGPEGHPGPPAPGGAPPEPAALARDVLEAARRSPSGWFGGDRVFIAHAWRSYRGLGGARALDLAMFKDRLVDLNRRGLLSLGRADLVEAMDPADVAESETAYLNARFHFIRVPGGRN